VPRLPKLTAAAGRTIDQKVDLLFDSLITRLLGHGLTGRNLFITTHKDYSLPGIFASATEAEGGRVDTDLLSGVAEIARQYIEKHRGEAKAKTRHSIQSLLQDLHRGRIDSNEFQNTCESEMHELWDSIRSNVERVVVTSNENAKTMGLRDGIIQINSGLGVDDPVVFFIPVKDDRLCLEQSEKVCLFRKGAKPVGELVKGDLLDNPSSPGVGRGRKVLHTEKKESEVLDLEFDNGRRICCTPDHPVLIKAGPTYCFIEARLLNESHDVVFADEVVGKGERQRLSHSFRAKSFMRGHADSWSYWRSNINDIVTLIRTEGRAAVLERYGMEVHDWDLYARYVVAQYAPDYGVVVEYDGSGHDMRDRLVKKSGGSVTAKIDYARDQRLRKAGFRVIRLVCRKDQFEDSDIVTTVRAFIEEGRGFQKWVA
jgi:very-short-patch-repair endonuclease